jgi:glyoxylase-like metal-dependent hydrolase (beta-lactamase superfamily II)
LATRNPAAEIRLPASLEFPVAAPPAPGETITIAPGILWLRMPLPFALNHINLWLVDDGSSWTAVDCGYGLPETTVLWERIFAEQLGGKPIGRIIVTHFHPDHIGLAGWLTERWDAPLWISEKEWLHARMMTGSAADDYTRSAHDFARRAGLEAAECDLFARRHSSYRRGVPSVPASYHRIGDGTTIEIGGREWQVIVGEGHAPEHACLYCAEAGVLIGGDQILPRISPNISVPPHEPDGDPLARYLRSLDKLRAALHLRIDELAWHHHERCDEVLGACVRPTSAVELLPVLFKRRLDQHQTAFALGEAIAHAHYLIGLDTLDRATGSDGIDRFLRKVA